MSDKKIYVPYYVPYFVEKARKYNLTSSQTILYGFIRFYTKNSKKQFFWTNKQLSKILWFSISTIKRALDCLDQKQLIQRIVYNHNRRQRKIVCFVPWFKNAVEAPLAWSPQTKYKNKLESLRKKMNVSIS